MRLAESGTLTTLAHPWRCSLHAGQRNPGALATIDEILQEVRILTGFLQHPDDNLLKFFRDGKKLNRLLWSHVLWS